MRNYVVALGRQKTTVLRPTKCHEAWALAQGHLNFILEYVFIPENLVLKLL